MGTPKMNRPSEKTAPSRLHGHGEKAVGRKLIGEIMVKPFEFFVPA